MAIFWQAVAWSIFLPAIILLALLLLPFPLFIRKHIVRLVDRVLFFRLDFTGIQGGVTLITLVLIVVGVLFLGSVREASMAESAWVESGDRGHRDKDVLLFKFRAERNAWVTGFGFTLWVVVWRINALVASAVRYQGEAQDLAAALTDLRGGAAPGSAKTAPAVASRSAEDTADAMAAALSSDAGSSASVRKRVP